MLPLSDNLFLTRTSSAGEGKTRHMAKGLILGHQDAIFAGESAGFGLPVVKTDRLTIFPSLYASSWQNGRIVETVYRLDLTLSWQILGLAAPSCFPVFMEKIVGFYMNRPRIQSLGLRIRNALFTLFQVRSAMTPGKNFGYCRIRYQTSGGRLTISVNGSTLQKGQLILLNEVSGTGFSRMKTGQDTIDGPDFLPWQACGFGSAIENPDLAIGFFLSIPENQLESDFQLAAGREVGRALNWAGMSLATEQNELTYHVNFYRQKK